ncbi:MAG: glycosyltransferase family A protein [Bacteroidales bacterium]
MLTVIIPTYNRAHMIGNAIRSLLRQSDAAELDILVIDDGSEDGTDTFIAGLMEVHSQIRYIRQENAGVAAARNTGLLNLLPQTEIVTFLDSDDVSPVGRFAADLPRLINNPTLDLTYARMMIISELNAETLKPTLTARTADVVSIHLSCTLIRRALVERIGLFNTELPQAEDTDYLLRIFESGSQFQQTDTPSLYYVRHQENLTRNTQEAARCFAKAIFLSVRRRRNDPSLSLNKPSFELQALQEMEAY